MKKVLIISLLGVMLLSAGYANESKAAKEWKKEGKICNEEIKKEMHEKLCEDCQKIIKERCSAKKAEGVTCNKEVKKELFKEVHKELCEDCQTAKKEKRNTKKAKAEVKE
jgi:hypothetical protein